MKPDSRFLTAALVLSLFALPSSLKADALGGSLTFEDVSPDNSDTDNLDPDGATGGRVNGLSIHPSDNDIMFAASEWGGIYSTTDAGLNWAFHEGHLPLATWDVEIDPATPTRIYATSFFDGKVASTAGINVSNDGGITWAQPATAVPPSGFCSNSTDEDERAAHGIAMDPTNSANVFIGTSCGLAVSNDSGVTWTYRDPTAPAGSGTRIWDVVAIGGGVVHVCGDDGHLRSDDGGASWVAGSGLASGFCSLAVSPDEPYVLLAVSGTSIYETTNANDPTPTWTQTRTNLTPQGRIPFVATNDRSDLTEGSEGLPIDVFDLWFGDVSLFRVQCTSGSSSGGAPRCGTGNTPAWEGPFTRAVGGHDDTGAILFDSEVGIDACPVLFSSDGGVYWNTDTTSDCHNPDWEQPDVTPHGIWPWSVSGANQPGATSEDLYFGLQDNGLFATTDAGAAEPTWHNEICCDGFDTSADSSTSIYTICCFGGGGRATRAFRGGPGFSGISQLFYPPTGLLKAFEYPDSFVNYAPDSWAMFTVNCTPGSGGCPGADGGLYITSDITATPTTWTELGDATEPVGTWCGLYGGNGGTPTFYLQTGSCGSTGTNDRLYRFRGTSPAGSWTEVSLPSGGFGVVGVDPSDPDRLMASGLTGSGSSMFRSEDGGDTWIAMPELDTLMNAGGDIVGRSTRGPSDFTGFFGYWQPSFVALDPNSSIAMAGGKNSGVFLSTDDGESWELITDPFTSDTSGVPHLPRPRYAYFDVEDGTTVAAYIGSQGRGIWRVELDLFIFADGFESGNTSAWSNTVP